MLQPLLMFLSGSLVSQLSGVSAIAYRHPDTHHGRAALLQTKNKLRVTKQRSRAQRAKRAGKYTTWKTKNGKKMQTSSAVEFPLMTFYAENDQTKDCPAQNVLPSIEECNEAVMRLGMERKMATVNSISGDSFLPACYYDSNKKIAYFNTFVGLTKMLKDLGGGDLYSVCKQAA